MSWNKYQTLLPLTVGVLLLSPVLLAQFSVYQRHNLGDVCDADGDKVVVPLGKQPAILSLSGPTSGSLKCHLELQAPKGFGFYIFIEKLDIKTTVDCKKEFLQFGR